jgi:hypothetical protein
MSPAAKEPSRDEGAQVLVSIDIEAKHGTPDQLVEQLISERNRFYPEWEFDGGGIFIHTTRMHASVEHSATATLIRWVRYREP